MLGLYFSGSGNTKFAMTAFCNALKSPIKLCSIEEEGVEKHIQQASTIVVAYPIYYSSLPKILYDFINKHGILWEGKQIFVIATMGLFSGDGSLRSATIFKQWKAHILGGAHIKMLDCISDVPLLKFKETKEDAVLHRAIIQLQTIATQFEQNIYPQTGLSFGSHMLGLFGQRLWFGHKTKTYQSMPKVDHVSCTRCESCIRLCPMNNLSIQNGSIETMANCTMCYRCVNACPTKSLTILGKQVVHQDSIGKAIKRNKL